MTFRKLLVLMFVAVVAVFTMSARADAHVEVSPSTAAAGTTVDLVFHVPNEEPTSATTKVELVIPEDANITVADTPTLSGWSPTITRTGSRVTGVTWAAGTIAPGASTDFPLTVEVPTTVDRVEFKALQTFADGTVTRWIDETPAGGAEPEHPAPVLTITGATTTTSTTATPSATVTTTTAVPASAKGKKGFAAKAGPFLVGFGVMAIVFAYLRTRALARRGTRR